MVKIRLIVFLLIAYFFKQLLWSALIPLWHFPDEEQHFSQTAFLAEKGRFPKGKEYDINKEIDQSSEILGTKRDGRGINKFTYHPEYRIPYTNSQIGLYEENIKKLNTQEDRQQMVKREAARYGPVYYFLASIPYKIFYKNDLLVRVFSSRLISVVISTITVFIVYLITKEIFKNELVRLIICFLVAFQPMFSFVSAGINSDNLFNLIFTLILFLCFKIFFLEKDNLISKRRITYLFFLAVVIIIGFLTKPQIVIGFPIIIFAFLLSFIKAEKKEKRIIVGILICLGTLFIIGKGGKFNIPDYNPNVPSQLEEPLFWYVFWHLKHTIAETIPWYWGVFNWLGVTLPRWVNRIQSRILIISFIGIFVFFIINIKNKKFLTNNNLKIIFLLGSALIYYFSVIFWDYFFRVSQGFSFGIQGRYFFPTIISHMVFIFLGLMTLVPKKLHFKFGKLLTIWWLVYSLIGLYAAVNAYYQIWPINIFLNQASQYKPVVFKAMGLGLIILGFIISLMGYLIKFLKLNNANHKKNY